MQQSQMKRIGDSVTHPVFSLHILSPLTLRDLLSNLRDGIGVQSLGRVWRRPRSNSPNVVSLILCGAIIEVNGVEPWTSLGPVLRLKSLVIIPLGGNL